jgi:hypothetical protein
MKRWGLKRDVEMGGARLAGETAGLLSPALLAAKAPQIAKGLLQAQENAAIPRQMNPQMGAIVYHGSPHKFDKFDSSKIGTGEGAQAYGHGMYLADSEGVARSYQKALGGGGGTVKGPDGNLFTNTNGEYDSALAYLRMSSDAPDPFAQAEKAIGHALNDKALHWSHREDARMALEQIQQLKKAGYTVEPGGHLYKVDLPDEAIAKMLDWDKPLSQQAPEVKKALEGFAKPGMTGREIYEEWATESLRKNGAGKDHNRYAADLAKQFGIPGIRYLDGGSRGAGTGTSNYVVFPGEEGLLSIVERNGQPLGGLMGKQPGTVKELRDALIGAYREARQQSPYSNIGVRVIGGDKPVKIGDKLARSSKWVDGAPLSTKLPGTSVFQLRGNEEDALRAIDNALSYNLGGKGAKLALVTADETAPHSMPEAYSALFKSPTVRQLFDRTEDIKNVSRFDELQRILEGKGGLFGP